MTVSADRGRPTVLDDRSGSRNQGSSTPTKAIYVDSDMVLLAAHQGRRGIELGMQADVDEGLARLSVVSDKIVLLIYPHHDNGHRAPDENRLSVLRQGLGGTADGLIVVSCPHDGEDCDCAKPGSGLIEMAVIEHGLERHHGWFIGADQEGVVSGRNAGLSTVRIGPLGADHLSSVHRPDYEARDLLDAANHILVEEMG